MPKGGDSSHRDEQARPFDSQGLLDGLTFNGPSDERVRIRGNPRSVEFKFSYIDHPLVGSHRGVKFDKPAPAIIPNNVRSFSEGCTMLACTVVSNKDYGDFFHDPPGPTYVVRADARTCPLIVEGSLGAGRTALVQLGRWQERNQMHRKFAASTANNVFNWLGC